MSANSPEPAEPGIIRPHRVSVRQMRKYLPTREQLREVKSLRFLGEMIFEPNLWHFNRHSVSFAFLVGIFCCFLPMPFQMVPCVLLCVWLRCNVPISIALVWVSNPITMPPMFYATYRLGTWLLGRENKVNHIVLSWQWLSSQIEAVWEPLLLGSVVTGLTLGCIGFVAVRLYWRWKIARYWAMRRLRNELAASTRSAARSQGEASPRARQDKASPEN